MGIAIEGPGMHSRTLVNHCPSLFHDPFSPSAIPSAGSLLAELLILTEATRSSVSRKEQDELQEWEHGYSEEMPPPAEGFFGDTLSDLPAAPFPSRNTATVQAGFLPFSIPTH